MSLTDSPKIVYSADGKPPDRKNWRRILVRGGLVLFFFIVLAINLYAFLAGNVANHIANTDGQIQGIVQDEQGQPIVNAEITVASYPSAIAQTDTNGRFTLSNVPTGAQYLLIVHQEIGQGFVIEVNSDGVTSLDPLVYDAKPAVWE